MIRLNNTISKLKIKLFVPPIIYELFKYIYRYNNPFYGLNNLDKKLLKYLNFENGYYIELGANDGITASNTLYFEKYKNWKGVLIEPIPHKYLECLKNRSQQNSIHCNACTSFEYNEKFVELFYSDTMTIPIGLESDISNVYEHAKIGEQFLKSGEKSFSFGAKSKTLNQILIDSKSPKVIDFFCLDVEGAEIEVLKGIDFTQYKFRYICIESRSVEKVTNFLAKYDYKCIDKLTDHDYLFEYSLPNLEQFPI